MASGTRRLYLLIHTPVHMGRPVQVGFVEKADWTDALFAKYAADVERNRQAGPQYRAHLSKREIEAWGFFPPCGARFEVMEIEIPEWTMNWLQKLPPTPREGETVQDTNTPTIEAIFKKPAAQPELK